MANEIIQRLESKLFPGLQSSIVLKEVGLLYQIFMIPQYA